MFALEKNMALWLWHPIFVHFTVGLLFTASILYILGALWRGSAWAPACLNAAKWIYWIGILMVLFTAVTGILAYFTVPDIDADTRMAINRHVISAVLTAATYLILAYFLWRRQRQNLPPSNGWTAWLVLGIILLCITGYLGGGLVFDRGVGVHAVYGSAT